MQLGRARESLAWILVTVTRDLLLSDPVRWIGKFRSIAAKDLSRAQPDISIATVGVPGKQTEIRAGGGGDASEQFERRKPSGLLKPGDDRLRRAHAIGQLTLRQACVGPQLVDQLRKIEP